MNNTQLQTIFADAHSRLAADQKGELARSEMSSPLAYLSLALLEALAVCVDQDEVGDLLKELVGAEHRKALRGALRDPLFALRAMIHGEALDLACAALIEALGAAQQQPMAVCQGMCAERIEHAKQIVATNYYEAPKDPAETRAEEALTAYLHSLRLQCNTVQMARIDPRDARHHAEMRLERVYIGLDTERQVELNPQEQEEYDDHRGVIQRSFFRDTRKVSALETLNQHPPARLMLLGGPGSGKSTFLNHLALCLAGAALGERVQVESTKGATPLERLAPHWKCGALLPIRVVLRELATVLPRNPNPGQEVDLLHTWLEQILGRDDSALALLRQALHDGRAILLFDGLDEVEAGPVLKRVTECIEVSAGIYTHSPVLVTCRVLDYQANEQRHLSGFQVETLAALNDEQIDAFINAWHDEVADTGRTMLGNAPGLRQALAGRTDMKEMARQPLLLTMMAIVHAGKGKLPDARALLYRECIELLLLRWRSEPDLLRQLGLPEFKESDLMKVMARIAFAAHNRSLSDSDAKMKVMARIAFAAHNRSLSDSDAKARPSDLSGSEVKAELNAAFTYYVSDEERRAALVIRLLRAFATRNGLLFQQSGESGEVYAFPHRSFQEFLAGYWISLQDDFDRLVCERAGQVGWHEALRLMVSYQALKDGALGRTLQVIKELLDDHTALKQTLAGELLALVGYARAAGYREEWVGTNGRWTRACIALRTIATADSALAAAPLRARAGIALGQLCYGSLDALTQQGATLIAPDPRLLSPATGDAPNGCYWCQLEPGSFWYGDESEDADDDEEELEDADDDEEELEDADDDEEDSNKTTEKDYVYAPKDVLQHVIIPYGFKIARYPVTNAEFAAFIAAGGYAHESWWTPEGWKYIQPDGSRVEGEPDRITLPRYWSDPGLNNPLQPIVGVSWYEAAAYCNWLTAQGHAQGWLPAEAVIRLPTSLEWEYAARGGDSQQWYPWGNDAPTPEHANYRETGIERPAPVGCFPLGRAACGAEDLVGNIQEWMATAIEASDGVAARTDFTFRERALIAYNEWSNTTEQLNCGSRVEFDPKGWNIFLGFRVIWLLDAHSEGLEYLPRLSSDLAP
ncbi:NACHT domain-containing protein [Candidatus Chloroploca asiatica]|uniref:Sulfatase-modifying factor enzyme-like domain-containing protein n=1 Tax=Candidatus Chloroploca asiatica TaxID=1506545 RepID=A0A2H3KIS4_9CHLR|nr:SUMF1/EgtB/PvdO family nonheme iron enzyme [Candidatus Chloroploca asiatica]PDV97774.1 hypothetical protein A9Q02_17685 [Candidatus Chloroploca asiatica]